MIKKCLCVNSLIKNKYLFTAGVVEGIQVAWGRIWFVLGHIYSETYPG